MKNLSVIFPIILFLALTGIPGINTLYAQDAKQEKENAKQEAIKEMISSRRYAFAAQSATPMSGQLKQLTSDYSLSIKTDTLEAYLPYYGRAFTATIGSTDGGINFKTSQFEYVVKDTKRGGWDITMKPKDLSDTKQLLLSISANGYATLQVISNDREMISFYGYIRAL